MKGFASDNNSGVHPRIMQALQDANVDHAIAYGDDPLTHEAISIFKKHFGQESEVYFVFNGTAANTLGITALTQSFHSVICANTAHINVDECGAPEKFSGCKVIALDSKNGKLTPETIQPELGHFGFEHHSQPRVISITQPTELGTLYSVDEIKALADLAHQNGMKLHMDGARIANAAVALGLPFRTFTVDAGVDILSFGGTKNGMMYGEAVVFLKPGNDVNFKYIRKQGMQLASKMRYIAAQFIAYFKDELWKANAAHSNRMAHLLCLSLKGIPEINFTQEVVANGVFAIIPPKIIPQLQEKYFFYVWDELRHEVRWMTSFDTSEEEVKGFAKTLQILLAKD